MISLYNPTGKRVRSDSAGDGHYAARRSKGNTVYEHKGVDFECEPGQLVYSPVDGVVVRVAYPYANDDNYMGLVIETRWCKVKMFYFEPFGLLNGGSPINQGDDIGIAQDISKRYPGSGMTPHVHLEIYNLSQNPELYIAKETDFTEEIQI